jgi:type VI secretion system secreted protein Hcp
MDLILLEPGNPEFVFGKAPHDGSSGSDAIWRDGATCQDRTKCSELVSLHQGQGIKQQ